MAAEIAARGGFGARVIEGRRGGGPRDARHYTFPALVTTQRAIDERPDVVAAAIRAVVRAQRALKDDPALAAIAAKGRFPAAELALLPDLVRRYAPYYDPAISREAVGSLNAFSPPTALPSAPAAYALVIPPPFQPLTHPYSSHLPP